MKKIIRVTILIISIMWVLHTFSKNFIVDPTFHDFISRKDQLIANESLWILMIRIHIILAITSLLTGPLEIIKRIRVKSLKFHRWNGRLYVLSIILNFIPGVYVSFFATGGFLSTTGFLILDILWLGTTILGYLSIKKQKVILHSQWMIRSFFLSFANMTIYIIVAITHKVLNFPYGTSYTIAVWLCWILNLLIAELIIRKKTSYKKSYDANL
ncbi:hypothetical protein BK742_17765 [Bacillus thuringiensis serovar pingluonsis]|uniref:DUF2306 domain-containing protein n=1 Tax=Bacillus thuringiensis serovar pingluonsis TaxID=180881 RepID=A0A243BBM9_BACTU|nr:MULTISPECIES: DUF2306 domain-containing protein [Bacillus cereus group]MEB9682983.1 DUF2306 domain-containing protein [Bacillus anthracis]OTY41985.1 hypothetical protein BK742_17765 [Bacillus thuringiensis serovar pingluonsis]